MATSATLPRQASLATLQTAPNRLDIAILEQQNVLRKVEKLKDNLHQVKLQLNEKVNLSDAYRREVASVRTELSQQKRSMEILENKYATAKREEQILRDRVSELETEKESLRSRASKPTLSTVEESGDQQNDASAAKYDDFSNLETFTEQAFQKNFLEATVEDLRAENERLRHFEMDSEQLKALLDRLQNQLAEAERECKRHENLRCVCGRRLVDSDASETSGIGPSWDLAENELRNDLLTLTPTAAERGRRMFGQAPSVAPLQLKRTAVDEKVQASVNYLNNIRGRFEQMIKAGETSVKLPLDKLLRLAKDSLEALRDLLADRDKYAKDLTNAQERLGETERLSQLAERKLKQNELALNDQNERAAKLEIKVDDLQQKLDLSARDYELLCETVKSTINQRNDVEKEVNTYRAVSEPLANYLVTKSQKLTSFFTDPELQRLQALFNFRLGGKNSPAYRIAQPNSSSGQARAAVDRAASANSSNNSSSTSNDSGHVKPVPPTPLPKPVSRKSTN